MVGRRGRETGVQFDSANLHLKCIHGVMVAPHASNVMVRVQVPVDAPLDKDTILC